MTLPNPLLLEQLSRAKHRELRIGARSRVRSPARIGGTIRIRLGRALIGAGKALSGEQVDMPARTPARPAVPRTA